tara:strand:- start:1267 stop:1503 length:237 start_codon:yes stop_codon:yes gene_type:complete
MSEFNLKKYISEKVIYQSPLNEELEFKNKDEVVDALVKDFGKNSKTFYNTPTNKNIEKFYTFNRTLRYYYDLKSGKKK